MAKRYEVLIELADGMMAVMLKTDELSEANYYANQLQSSGKYRGNLVKVSDRYAYGPKWAQNIIN